MHKVLCDTQLHQELSHCVCLYRQLVFGGRIQSDITECVHVNSNRRGMGYEKALCFVHTCNLQQQLCAHEC